MVSTTCKQPFVFGPSKRYISTLRIDLPILIVRRDGKEDVLTVPTYLVDAEVPFLCGKETLEDWNFQISGREKKLEMTFPTEGSRIKNPNYRYTGWSLWNCIRNTKKTKCSLYRRCTRR